MKLTGIFFTLTLSAFALSIAGYAQTRTWVSGVGDDANPCSRTAPCKTFAGAISKTATGGEIDVLDPGGFGEVIITKSITIDGGGGQVASVLVSGTNGITVAAPAGSVVNLRNLRLQGIYANNSGLNGIELESGGVLHIENCAIYGFSGDGIEINSSTPATVLIDDTTTQDNYVGLFANASSVPVHVVASNSHFSNNYVDGVYAQDNNVVTVRNSDANGNGQSGFHAEAFVYPATVYLYTSGASGNGAEGLLAGGGGASASIFAYTTPLFDEPHQAVTLSNGHITRY